MVRPPIMIVLGATGAGKSKLALDLAKKFGGEIINADAMQMYKGLDIATNKVTSGEKAAVKHHALDFLDPLSAKWTVVDFRNHALPIINQLLNKNVMPVICGGTNYYIESLVWKILLHDGESEIDESESGFGSVSSQELYDRLRAVDEERAAETHPNDRRKILRSLRIFESTGVKHSELLRQQRGQDGGHAMGGPLRYPKEQCFAVWVQCEQSILDQRCDSRVDKMIKRGLLKELQDFHDQVNLKRGQNSDDFTVGMFQAIGFKEFNQYLKLTGY